MVLVEWAALSISGVTLNEGKDLLNHRWREELEKSPRGILQASCLRTDLYFVESQALGK